MALTGKTTLRLVKNQEDPEGPKDPHSRGVCGKCSQTVRVHELAHLRGAEGLLCKKCRSSDFMQLVMIAVGVSIILGFLRVLLANN
jgi:hypothetical protein